MKRNNWIIKSLFVAVFAIMALSSCDDAMDAIKTGAKDMDSSIVSMDKTLAEPGDVITFTGQNLDQVYKIMLENENIIVRFEATATELKMTIPSMTPLGDAITVSFFFPDRGVAQRVLTIQSPPTVLGFTPSAAKVGDDLLVLGRELHLTDRLFIGDVELDFIVLDDRSLSVVITEEVNAGSIMVVSETGSESISENEFVIGEEIMVQNYDGGDAFYEGPSNNGNIGEPFTETGDFIRGDFLNLPLEDRGSSWGGNFDIYLLSLPERDIQNVSLVFDMKGSTSFAVSVMVQNAVDVFGQHVNITPDWQTFSLPLTELLQGYGNNGDPFSDAFSSIHTVKIQPPAQSTSAYIGETVSIDNIKFIVVE